MSVSSGLMAATSRRLLKLLMILTGYVRIRILARLSFSLLENSVEMLSLRAKLSISLTNKFVFRFDDGDIHPYLRKDMTTMMATKFSELSNMSELGSSKSTDVEKSEADLRESDS